MLRPLFKLLRIVVVMCLMSVLYLVFKLPFFGPFLKERFLSKQRRPGEYLETELTPDTLRHWWTCTYSDMYYKQAFRNCPAPNTESLVREFHDVADFLIIYIQEAHPLDEWNITGHQYSHLRQHVNLQERVTAASLLDSHALPCPVAVDPMDNKATLLYSAVPKRLYVIQEGVVRYAGGMGTHRYRLKHIDRWLQKYKKSLATQAIQNDEDKIENNKLD